MRARFPMILLILALPGCSGSTMTGTTGGGGGGGRGVSASVAVQDYAFAPASITIKAGGAVTWTNTGPSTHTVTSDSAGVFDSGMMAGPMGSMDPYGGTSSGDAFTMTFPTPGTYKYHCTNHATMHGTVVVQ